MIKSFQQLLKYKNKLKIPPVCNKIDPLKKHTPVSYKKRIHFRSRHGGFGDWLYRAIAINNIQIQYPDIEIVPLNIPNHYKQLLRIRTDPFEDLSGVITIGHPRRIGYSVYCQENIIDQVFNKIINELNIKITIKDPFPPVIHTTDDRIPSVDIVMTTNCGKWNTIRRWPFFAELKQLLDNKNIAYIDLDERKLRGNECLEYVRKCKIYLTLETGTTCYVSQFSQYKTIFLQSGFIDHKVLFGKYWHHDVISSPCEYSPCHKNKCNYLPDDKYHHMCMRNISPEIVMDKIESML